NYPGLSLSQAIDAVAKLWQHEKKTAVSHETAALAMEFKSLSGPARVTIGALRQYGLIEKAEKGHIRVSDDALIILHGPESDRNRTIMGAAGMPDLFADLLKTHAEASETAIRSYLITKKGFAEDGARKAARAFRETMNLAASAHSG